VRGEGCKGSAGGAGGLLMRMRSESGEQGADGEQVLHNIWQRNAPHMANETTIMIRPSDHRALRAQRTVTAAGSEAEI
jgi:hypothetical protein